MDAEPLDERHSGILDAAVVGAALPPFVGREHDAPALDADRDAVVDDHLGQADPGHVAGGDQPGQQVQPAVRGVPGRRVEDPFGFPRLSGSGDMTVPMRVNGTGCRRRTVTGQPLTPEPMSLEVKWRWKTTNSPITGAASTHAPARIEPNGLAARDARLEM